LAQSGYSQSILGFLHPVLIHDRVRAKSLKGTCDFSSRHILDRSITKSPERYPIPIASLRPDENLFEFLMSLDHIQGAFDL